MSKVRLLRINITAIAVMGMVLTGCVEESTTETTTIIDGETPPEETLVTLVHNSITYGVVTSPATGRIWLDRNLGAQRACNASDDSQCFGDYYQWGRKTDGHEKSNSTAVSTQVAVVNNTGSNFYFAYNDWSTIDDDGALREANWNKTDGSKLCPVGYRVPTKSEIANETSGAGNLNTASLFGSFLKFSTGGYHDATTGNMDQVGDVGYYWSQDAGTEVGKAKFFAFTSSQFYLGTEVPRSHGYSVRCIKD